MKYNRRILVIDDDPGVRGSYRSILQPDPVDDLLSKGREILGEVSAPDDANAREKYQLTLSESGEEAIRSVMESVREKRHYAMAFVDMSMPGMDGAETVKRIWHIDPHIKIVIVTAYSKYTPDQIVGAVGRDDIIYLRKPFNHLEISQLGRALTNQWNLERERNGLAERLRRANRSLEDLNRNLEEKVAQKTMLLIQSEKMSSLGVLIAGVAHEINNPLSFVLSNMFHLRDRLDAVQRINAFYNQLGGGGLWKKTEKLTEYSKEKDHFKKQSELDRLLQDMRILIEESLEGGDRIANIVKELRVFSRADNGEAIPADPHAVLDSALNLMRNDLKYDTKLIKQYGRLPKIPCFPQKLSQLFLNLLMNAVQAIEKQGTITIATRLLKHGKHLNTHCVEIKISDSGNGIPEEEKLKIFDPFFTTKPVGKGTGLGLSIAYDIVQLHKGFIGVENNPGNGCTFTIELPTDRKSADFPPSSIGEE